MIDTTDLSSYYPGYDDYCEDKENIDIDNFIIDEVVDEMLLENLKKEESV